LGIKRKCAKTSRTPKGLSATAAADRTTKESVSPVVGSNAQVPEKRKRGKFYHRLLCLVRRDRHINPILLTTKQDETIQQQQPPYFVNETQWLQQQQFPLAVSFLSSAPLWRLPTRLDKTTVTRIRLLNALHPPLAYAPDIISQFLLLRHSIKRIYIQVFHLLVSVMVLASFVASWFAISFRFGFNKKQILCVDFSGMVIKLFVGKVL
jgi:hypothetical protein